MVSTARLVQALGGKGVLRERQTTYEAIIDKARAGLPFATLEAIASRFEIAQDVLVRILHLPARTLARRKKSRRLSADESDRLLRLARVVARAEEVSRAARSGPGPGCADQSGRWAGPARSTCSIPTSGRSRSSRSSAASSTASTADPRLADRPHPVRGLRRRRRSPAWGPLDPAGHPGRLHLGEPGAGGPRGLRQSRAAGASGRPGLDLGRHSRDAGRLPGGAVGASGELEELSRAGGARRSGRALGQELKAPVLAVPSAVIPQELNYLLNPRHADFKRIRVGKPEAFRFDPRLRRR